MNNKWVKIKKKKQFLLLFYNQISKNPIELVWMLLIIEVEVKWWTNFSNGKAVITQDMIFPPLSHKG